MTWSFWWISGLIALGMETLTRKNWCEKERKLWASFAVDSYSSVLRWTVIVQNYHDKRGKNKCRNFGRCIYNWQYCCKHTCLLSGRIFRHCHCRPVSVAGESGLSDRETTTSASDGWVSHSQFRLLTPYTHTEQVPPNPTLPSLSKLTVIGWHQTATWLQCFIIACLTKLALSPRVSVIILDWTCTITSQCQSVVLKSQSVAPRTVFGWTD